MSDTRWQQIEKVFHQALKLPPHARPAFLNQACGVDEDLRREVESLLAFESENGSTFAGPAAHPESEPLPDGTVVSHYRILGKLGEGGMGVVYRAEDVKLGRQVAVKFLSAEAGEPPKSALRRFEREARSASSLNHPNICTVHGFEDFDGRPAIVMELLEGETLAARIARGRLPVAEALRLAIQIAAALAEAHRRSVVHRDLKPANVMVTHSGLVKVLDFGLARPTGQSLTSVDEATYSMTMQGMLVGSVPYMSPEQAEGKTVDERSDIFSFGGVLYEMLSGQRAFNAETGAATLAAILNQQPAALAEIAPEVPAELERIVARCLRKDVARRSQSIAEIKVVLEELQEAT
jgi:serine/threonine protein kinase